MARAALLAQKISAASDSGLAASSATPDRALDPIQALSLKVPLVLQSLCLWLIVLAMTPYTYRLDAIKEAFYFAFGPTLFLVGLWPVFRRAAPPPHRIVIAGLLLYGLTLVLSTLTAEFSWAGWNEVVFYWASVGFFLGAAAVGFNPLTARRFLAVVTLLLLVVNLIGFLQYDLLGTGGSVASWMFDRLYDGELPRNPSLLAATLYTYAADATTRLMSTILNRDFYAAFCLLFFPFALVFGLTSTHRAWKAIGIITTIFALVSVFLAKSKGEYITGAAELLLFLGLYTFAIQRPNLRRGHLWVWALGGGLLLLALVFVNLPTLTQQLKSLGYSFTSRGIIWSGAWQIFLAFPILGSGPGTFRLYFPRYRAADYYEHEISNLTNYAHNFLLDILSETGFVGLLAYALFAAPLAFFAFRAIFRAPSRELRLYLIACVCGLFGIYGSNLTSVSIRWPIGAVGLWTVLGLTSGLIRQSEPDALPASVAARNPNVVGPPPKVSPWAWITVAGASLMLLVSCFHAADYWATHRAYGRAIGPMNGLRDIVISHVRGQRPLSPAQQQEVVSQLERVAADFRQSIAIDPTHLSAYYKLGSVESLLASVDPDNLVEHLEASLETYLRLQELAPDYAEMHYNLGIIHWRLAGIVSQRLDRNADQFTAAERAELADLAAEHERRSLAAFERMGSMSTKAEVLSNLGSTYHGMEKFRLALATFRRANDLYPDNEEFAQRYYQLALHEGEVPDQIRALQSLYRLNPRNTELLYGKGGALRLALDHDLPDLFEQTWQLAQERNPVDSSLYGMLIPYAASRGDHDQSVRAALAYLRLGGRRPEFLQTAIASAEQTDAPDLSRRLTAALQEAGVDDLSPDAAAPAS